MKNHDSLTALSHKKLKILHLTHTHIPSDSRILKEIYCLVDAGYKVAGIGVGRVMNTPSGVPDKFEHINVDIKSRKLLFLPKVVRHFFTFLEILIKVIPKSVAYNADIIHCHDTFALFLGVVTKSFLRVKLIYDAHELESEKNGQSQISKKFILFFERLVWKSITALIVVSPSIESWYRCQLGGKRTEVILNSPVLAASDIEDSNYLRTKFSVPPDQNIFIYVGGLTRGRGLEIVAHIFSENIKSAHLVFLGYGPLSQNLKMLASDNQNIHFHESVPHVDVVSIVRSADFGVCLIENVSLSDYYCLPNKLFEYSFAGLPVVASNFPDIHRVVTEYKLGICCDLELDLITQAILDLDNSNTKHRVKDLRALSWKAQEKKLLRLYAELDNKTV